MSTDGQKSSGSRAIPGTRRVTVLDPAHMPHDYSSTPGGTVFSTTPGGTRIIYDRKFLLERRSSPLAQTPPRCLPHIPGVTSPSSSETRDHSKEPLNNSSSLAPPSSHTGDEDQFQMDMEL
ncbi:eukaryotic translation initiation factor 4E-binding protein 2-like [Boleophthalmus pectinirostris]|uniref:eukaryotic translation initiation factor 4E-binding protein 2-like n=1 Tax=Boleophthalmus pectinirostris TaxID=150288 RepID=UPI000A1C28D4|nr:eukaryotic translation initiation factor 4E-binding protein 2-like [Boleophthalmus pectinirostris]